MFMKRLSSTSLTGLSRSLMTATRPAPCSLGLLRPVSSFPIQSRAFPSTTARFYSTEPASSSETDSKSETTQPSPEKKDVKTIDYEKLLKEKDDQIATLRGAYTMALADAENVRQRTKRELADKEVYAIQKFAKDLLDTVDVLAMALDSVPESVKSAKEGETNNKDLENLYTGVSMTRTQLLKTLARFGVEPIDALNQPFDPNMHQALFQAPIPGKEAGTVFQVTKAGYKIGDRVLRPAQVGVVKSQE